MEQRLFQEALAIASPSCVYCEGKGVIEPHWKSARLCRCVLRKIFRICLRRYFESERNAGRIGTVSMDYQGVRVGRVMYGRKEQEFAADFWLVSRRTLSPLEFRILDLHFLHGADWRACCGKLGIKRGNFFHYVYAIEQRMARVFVELEPYPLYPLIDYFTGSRPEPAGPVDVAPPKPAARAAHIKTLRKGWSRKPAEAPKDYLCAAGVAA